MLEYENAFAQISYEHPRSTIRLQWTTKTENITDAELRGTLLALSTNAVKYRAEKVLIDARNFRYSIIDDTAQWFINTLMPFMLRVGLKKTAVLFFDNTLGEELALKLWAINEESSHQIMYFIAEIEALEWLA